MNPLVAWLERYPVLVLDGALATELERRGCDLRDPLWSAKVLLEAPALIRQIHENYFLAGADCAITASYQASIGGFQRRGLSQTAALALLRRSVDLAMEARDAFWRNPDHRNGRGRPLVAASIGPYGATLADGSEYRGDDGLSEEELMEFHRPRMAALLEAAPDLLACETIPSFREARALSRLLTEFPDACAWISFSAKDQAHLCDGELLAECAAWLDRQPQVVALGVNCTAPRYLPGLIEAAREVTRKPIIVYPNSGESYDPVRREWRGLADAASFATEAKRWHAAGARLIGGCCRTTPDHIRAIGAWAHALTPR